MQSVLYEAGFPELGSRASGRAVTLCEKSYIGQMRWLRRLKHSQNTVETAV